MSSKVNKIIEKYSPENFGLVTTARGAELIISRKKKEIILDKVEKSALDKPIFLMDKEFLYGLIQLNKPQELDKNFFNNRFKRHLMPNELRDRLWPGISKFYAYSFKIIKFFEEPQKHNQEPGPEKGFMELDMDKILNKSVMPYKNLGRAAEDTAWSGPAEIKAASIEDLKLICAWFDSDKPDVKGSYKLPHHKASGHSAVFRGVAAAMGALLGARGGVNIPSSDRKGVYNHLAKHYKEFEKEAPAFKDYSLDELKSLFPELYEDLVLIEASYAGEIEKLNSMQVAKRHEKVKSLFIQLYKLFVKRLIDKSYHGTSGKRCPSGMRYDARSGKCVRRSAKSDYDEQGFIKAPKVEVTDTRIRVRLREPNTIIDDSFRTIILSKSRGIQAVIGRLKRDPDGATHVQSVLFDKEKWSTKDALAWVHDHIETLKSSLILGTKGLTIDYWTDSTSSNSMVNSTLTFDSESGLATLYVDGKSFQTVGYIICEVCDKQVHYNAEKQGWVLCPYCEHTNLIK